MAQPLDFFFFFFLEASSVPSGPSSASLPSSSATAWASPLILPSTAGRAAWPLPNGSSAHKPRTRLKELGGCNIIYLDKSTGSERRHNHPGQWELKVNKVLCRGLKRPCVCNMHHEQLSLERWTPMMSPGQTAAEELMQAKGMMSEASVNCEHSSKHRLMPMEPLCDTARAMHLFIESHVNSWHWVLQQSIDRPTHMTGRGTIWCLQLLRFQPHEDLGLNSWRILAEPLGKEANGRAKVQAAPAGVASA